jgi:hypothetical protein
MSESSRFAPVFEQLRAILREEAQQPARLRVEVVVSSDAGMDELDEINHLRRIVLDVTEPEQLLFTTT